MRQVPPHSRPFLIIGRGRLALNLSFYFDQLQIPYKTWHRGLTPETLKICLEDCGILLLAISDSAIESFIQENNLQHRTIIHFSGALQTPLALAFHPLMTFTHNILPLETWKSVPFVGHKGQPNLSELIPLPNPCVLIPADLAPLYHSLCVVSGNGMAILWQQTFESWNSQLGLPIEILFPYLEQVTKNLMSDSQTSLTGPWARRDTNTIEKNSRALQGHPLEKLYSTFKETAFAGGSYEIRP